MSDAEVSVDGLFFQALREGRIQVQQCARCGHKTFPARTHCTSCRSVEQEWTPMNPGGSIYAWTQIPETAQQAGRNIILVDMDDGFRMMSTLQNEGAHGLQIGARVCASIDATTEPARVVFHEEKAA